MMPEEIKTKSRSDQVESNNKNNSKKNINKSKKQLSKLGLIKFIFQRRKKKTKYNRDSTMRIQKTKIWM
jgi:hypothetical protein